MSELPEKSDSCDSVHLANRRIFFRIRRSSRARREGLVIDDNGLWVVLPRHSSDARAMDVIRRHAPWVLRHLTRWEKRRARRAPPLADNEMLLEGKTIFVDVKEEQLLGRLSWVERTPDRVRVVVAESNGKKFSDENVSDGALKTLVRWIDDTVRRRLNERLAVRAIEMGLSFDRFVVKDQRSLWGSCSRRRRSLSFNRRLLLAPPEVLDYIVVHELAHLRFQGHGPRFWERVARHDPNFRDHRRWLKENGAHLRLPTVILSEAKDLLPLTARDPSLRSG